MDGPVWHMAHLPRQMPGESPQPSHAEHAQRGGVATFRDWHDFGIHGGLTTRARTLQITMTPPWAGITRVSHHPPMNPPLPGVAQSAWRLRAQQPCMPHSRPCWYGVPRAVRRPRRRHSDSRWCNLPSPTPARRHRQTSRMPSPISRWLNRSRPSRPPSRSRRQNLYRNRNPHPSLNPCLSLCASPNLGLSLSPNPNPNLSLNLSQYRTRSPTPSRNRARRLPSLITHPRRRPRHPLSNRHLNSPLRQPRQRPYPRAPLNHQRRPSHRPAPAPPTWITPSRCIPWWHGGAAWKVWCV